MIRKTGWMMLLVMLWAMPVAAGLSTESARALFNQANQQYRDKNYPQAIQSYEQILQGGLVSGPLYYNLANSYFKQGDLGRAVLNYERARRLMPRDSDLRMNYQYTLAKIKNPMVDLPLSIWDRIWQPHARFYTRDEALLLMASWLGFAGALYLLGLYFVSVRRWTMPGAGLFLMLTVIYGYGLCYQVHDERGMAVALAVAEAKFEPQEKATTHFTLPEGQRCRILRRETDWAKIQRPDGKSGWVPAKNIAAVE